MSLSVKGLVKRYGQQTAVDHISFQIDKGIVGFLGPNGAGKSTTMKMITGYLSPDEGEILISGVKMSTDNIAAKQKIGYLPESNPLYVEMYVREYLLFIAGLHGLKRPSKLIEERIEQLGLTQESHKHIHQLSKGYKQRVGLAAALLHDPEILVLDEPT
jgi:ABC-2 type transport system ATP-binding protein